MVEKSPAPLNRVFQALADPTRRALLARLAEAPGTVSELAAPHRMSLAAVSKHLQALERAGLVEREVSGRRHLLRLRPQPLADAWAWLGFYQRFWNERLDSLDELLRGRRTAAGRQDTEEPEP